MKRLTPHAELVERAGRWLRNTLGCSVTLLEFKAYCLSNEIPDAIGWNQRRCVMVECKTSHSDFLADLKKHSRHPKAKHALGAFRFYLTLPGIIKPEEVPAGWGLYEVHGRSVKHIAGISWTNAKPAPFSSCKHSEVGLLLSALRRSKYTYKHDEQHSTRYHLPLSPKE